MKKELNILARRVMEESKQSKERAIERLDMMEDICFIQGKTDLAKKVAIARQFIQRNYY